MKPIDIKRGDRFVAREMIRMVFFLGSSHSRASAAVMQALGTFLDFSGREKAYVINHPGGDWDHHESSGSLLAAAYQRLESKPRQLNCSLIVCSDDHNISDFSFEYSGFNLDDPGFASWASVVKLTMPPTVFSNRMIDFQAVFLSLLTILPSFFAYSTLALEGDQAVIQQAAKRYMGLDISSVASVAKSIDRNASGVYWLNAYKGDLARSVKPILSRQSRPSQVQVANLDDETILVQLSPEPDRLAVQRLDLVVGYRWLASELHQGGLLHSSGRIVYFEDEDAVDDVDAQRDWHERFLRNM